MKRQNAPSITTLIGILLVIVALVSAGGLYFVASEYSKISETLASTTAYVSNVNIIQDNQTNEVMISFSVIVDNTSELDLDVYRVETYVYAFTQDSSKFVGSANTGITVRIPSGTMNTVPVSMTVNASYMGNFLSSITADNIFGFMVGSLWFEITKYPDVEKRMEIFNQFQAVVVYE